MAGVAVACTAHAADSVEHRRVHLEVVDQTFDEMKTEDVSEDEDAAGGVVAEWDDLADAAFHFGEGFFDHGCLDHGCGFDADTGEGEFVDLGRDVGSGLIHRFGQMFTDDVDYEDAV